MRQTAPPVRAHRDRAGAERLDTRRQPLGRSGGHDDARVHTLRAVLRGEGPDVGLGRQRGGGRERAGAQGRRALQRRHGVRRVHVHYLDARAVEIGEPAARVERPRARVRHVDRDDHRMVRAGQASVAASRDDEHRARRRPDDRLGDAPEAEVLQPAPPVRAHHQRRRADVRRGGDERAGHVDVADDVEVGREPRAAAGAEQTVHRDLDHGPLGGLGVGREVVCIGCQRRTHGGEHERRAGALGEVDRGEQRGLRGLGRVEGAHDGRGGRLGGHGAKGESGPTSRRARAPSVRARAGRRARPPRQDA